MDEMWTALKSPVTWVVGGLMSFLMSLVASYVKVWLDARFARFLTWRARQTEEVRDAERQRTRKLAGDPQAQIIELVTGFIFVFKMYALSAIGLLLACITVLAQRFPPLGANAVLVTATVCAAGAALAIGGDRQRESWHDVYRAYLVDRGKWDLEAGRPTEQETGK